ncbi:hypothetical protein PIB30_081268 [Stylosanthes scabra]|uniref:Uncharacterized protein n=1 Tax=Stylosanthes scabra TaxID=79078 RepID=A0ABU6XRP6_9FABA|nr:hypothetical protein [Stylosanthes scabra]
MEQSTTSSFCNLGILHSLSDDSLYEILHSYDAFCAATQTLLSAADDLSVRADFVARVHSLCKHGLHSLVRDHFLRVLEETFERNGASRFWRHFEPYSNVADLNKNDDLEIDEDEILSVLHSALEEIYLEKGYQEKCLLMLAHAFELYKKQVLGDSRDLDAERNYLTTKYQWIVSSVLTATLPRNFRGV